MSIKHVDGVFQCTAEIVFHQCHWRYLSCFPKPCNSKLSSYETRSLKKRLETGHICCRL